MKKNKPQLAIAYYADGEAGEVRNNAYVYVSLDDCSDREFEKLHKKDFDYVPSDFDVYPVQSLYEPNDVKGTAYKIILEAKPDDDDDVSDTMKQAMIVEQAEKNRAERKL